MKYLITGGTGFLGSYVAKNLIDGGHHVVCYDFAPNVNSIQQVLTREELESVTIRSGNICDLAGFTHVCQDEKVDTIIHLAGLLKSACEENVPAAIDTNLSGTVNIFEAARICGIKRVVYASSIDAIGQPDFIEEPILRNDVPHMPLNIYGKLKDACEFMGAFYNTRYGLETVGLRYVVTYGKARMRGGSNWIVELLNKPAMNIDSVVPFGDATSDMIYVKDAAGATVLAASVCADRLKQPAYTITGEAKSVREMRDYVAELLPHVDIQLQPGTLELEKGYDGSAAREDLGYTPKYSVFEGIRETIRLIRTEAGLTSI